MLAPVIKWPGSKWRLARWIVAQLPPHRFYCEPFFGSGAVLLTKDRSDREYLNDRSGRVVNLFRVLRDQTEALCRVIELTPWAREEFETCSAGLEEGDAVEQARRFLVANWQQVGVEENDGHRRNGWRTSRTSGCPAISWTRLPYRIAVTAERLRGVNIECRPALDVIQRYAYPEMLFYCDPPYPLDSRGGALYHHEMSDQDHRDLLQALRSHPGPVLLSSYHCSLYAEMLGDWECREHTARDQTGEHRQEILWCNPVALALLRDQHPQLAFEEVPG
jgi:DNA adenine methylase